jgi:hypothetical protein
METSMRRTSINLGRLGAAAAATAIVASVALVAPVSAATGNVTVTGSSASKIVLSIGDNSAQFGSAMTPDGDASGEAGTALTAAAGACYPWAGTANVKANVAYDLSVAAGAANDRLDFLTTSPGTYSACTNGQQFSTTPYAWASNVGKTASRDHSFWIGLDVQWTDDPTSFSATLTVTAIAHT